VTLEELDEKLVERGDHHGPKVRVLAHKVRKGRAREATARIRVSQSDAKMCAWSQFGRTSWLTSPA